MRPAVTALLLRDAIESPAIRPKRAAHDAIVTSRGQGHCIAIFPYTALWTMAPCGATRVSIRSKSCVTCYHFSTVLLYTRSSTRLC